MSICKKVVFANKKKAVERIAEIQAEEGKNKKPIRSYRCEKCGNFHLTSWNKKKKRMVEDIQVIKEIDIKEDEEQYWRKLKGW